MLLIYFVLIYLSTLDHSSAQVETHIIGPYRIELFNAGKNYADAKSACEARNAWLVEIKSKEFGIAVTKPMIPLNMNTWIGAKDIGEGWKWNDGTEIVYSNWKSDKPSSTTCPLLDKITAKWTGVNCADNRFYVCQSDAINIVFYGSTELYFDHTTVRNYANSKKICEDRGSKLVEIKDSSINTELLKELNTQRGLKRSNDDYYITSANDLDTDGTWIWGDRTSLDSYENWYTGTWTEPNGDTRENCLTMTRSLMWAWADVNCDAAKYHAICQKILSPATTCSTDICSNNGTCSVSGSRYVCSCNERYGSKCEIDPCKPNPCKNDGSCVFVNSYPFYKCSCQLPFNGTQCSERVFFTNENCKYHINHLEKIDYKGAEYICQNMSSGALAMTKSQSIFSYIEGKIKLIYKTSDELKFWVGGTKLSSNWQFVDGTPLPGPDFKKWASDEPSTGERLCLGSDQTSWTQLYWYSGADSETHGYICEVPVNDPCNPTPCINGGSCSSIGCQWNCACSNGYSGTRCEHDKLLISPTQASTIVLVGESATITLNVKTEVGPVNIELFKYKESNHIGQKNSVGNGSVLFVIGPMQSTSRGQIYEFKSAAGGVTRTLNVTIAVHASANITGIVPPNIAIPSIISDLTMACSASGFPVPSVFWYLGNTLISGDAEENIYQTNSSGMSMLNLHHVNKSNAGVYTCRAMNVIGQANTQSVKSLRAKVIAMPEYTATGNNCSLDIVVKWTPGTEATNVKHRIEASLVNVVSATSNKSIVEWTPTNTDPITSTVKRLRQLSSYIVKMSICLDQCVSGPDEGVEVSTGIGVPVAVQGAEISDQRVSKTCTVSWTMPNISQYITGFKVTTHSVLTHANTASLKSMRFNETFDIAMNSDRQHSFNTKQNRNYTVVVQAKTCAGAGRTSQAVGYCISETGAPTSVVSPSVSKIANEDKTRDIEIPPIDQTSGPISCVLIIVERSAQENNGNVSSSFTADDLNDTQENSQSSSPGDGKRYIAIVSSNVTSETLTLKLGDGVSSSCDIHTLTGTNRRKRAIPSSIKANNFPLEEGKFYSYFTVTTTPGENNTVYFGRSASAAFKNTANPNPQSMSWIGAVIAVIVLLVLVTIVLLLLYKRRQASTKKSSGSIAMTDVALSEGKSILGLLLTRCYILLTWFVKIGQLARDKVKEKVVLTFPQLRPCGKLI